MVGADAGVAAVAVVVALAVTLAMVAWAVTVSKHGLIPTRGWTANVSRWGPLKRQAERVNEEVGWGDTPSASNPDDVEQTSEPGA
jgi:hypothetical protein